MARLPKNGKPVRCKDGTKGFITGPAGAGLNGGYLVWVDIKARPVEIEWNDEVDGWIELSPEANKNRGKHQTTEA